jgi:hypothetical protein
MFLLTISDQFLTEIIHLLQPVPPFLASEMFELEPRSGSIRRGLLEGMERLERRENLTVLFLFLPSLIHIGLSHQGQGPKTVQATISFLNKQSQTFYPLLLSLLLK